MQKRTPYQQEMEFREKLRKDNERLRSKALSKKLANILNEKATEIEKRLDKLKIQ